MNNDDLIVFPGAGRAGRTTTPTSATGPRTRRLSQESRLAQRRPRAPEGGTDTAAYWVPTLFSNGRAVTPRSATIYYRRRTTDRVQAFPQGLRMIAGTSTATAGAAAAGDVSGTAGRLASAPSRASTGCPHAATGRSSVLNLHVNFPNCWNGHITRQRRPQEPPRRLGPRRLPGGPIRCRCRAISLIVHYAGAGWIRPRPTSRRAANSRGHGDFVNAWDQDTLEALVAALN